MREHEPSFDIRLDSGCPSGSAGSFGGHERGSLPSGSAGSLGSSPPPSAFVPGLLSGSPSHPSSANASVLGSATLGSALTDSSHDTAVSRRQAEWERQIVSIDKKEKEVHQTQLRLIREQTSAFIRDLAALRQEVASLRASHPSHNDMAAGAKEHAQKLEALKDLVHQHKAERDRSHGVLHEQVAALERDHGERTMRLEKHCAHLGEHVSQHMHLNGEKQLSIQAELEKVARMEQQLWAEVGAREADVEELRKGLDGEKLAREGHFRSTQDEQHSVLGSVKKRVEYLEHMLGDSCDKQTRDLNSARGKLDHLQGRFALHSSLPDRMEYIEQIIGEFSDKQEREAEAARSKVEERHEKVLHELQAMQEEKASQQESIHARLEFLEKAHGHVTESHSSVMEGLRTQLEHHQSHSATATERLAKLEKQLGGSRDQHAT